MRPWLGRGARVKVIVPGLQAELLDETKIWRTVLVDAKSKSRHLPNKILDELGSGKTL
jgi:hypothetical protein